MEKKVYVQPSVLVVDVTLQSEIAGFNILSSQDVNDVTTQHNGTWGGLWQ